VAREAGPRRRSWLILRGSQERPAPQDDVVDLACPRRFNFNRSRRRDRPYGYGKPASPAEIVAGHRCAWRRWCRLTPRQWTVAKGVEVYADQCAVCHGAFGEGEGRFPSWSAAWDAETRPAELTSAATGRSRRHCGITLTAPCRCRRQYTSADDVYALTAYILHLNDSSPAISSPTG